MNTAEDPAAPVKGLLKAFHRLSFTSWSNYCFIVAWYYTAKEEIKNLQDQDSFWIKKKERMPSEEYNIYVGYRIAE